MASNLRKDKGIKALHAGKRISSNGNTYYEYRKNRSDKDRRKKFENGGGLFGTSRSKSALAKDRKYFNKNEEHEVQYAKTFKRRKKTYDKYEIGGGVGKALHLQMSNLDKLSAEQSAKIFENYNKVVEIKKQDNGLYSIYTSSISGDKEYSNGGGVGCGCKTMRKPLPKLEYKYGGELTDENMVRENLVNGEIHLDILQEIIGHKPNYPHQIVGCIKLEKCFLKPYYKIS